MTWRSAILRRINLGFASLGLELRRNGNGKLPWDHIYERCVEEAKTQGRDPNDILDERWQGSPSTAWLERFILPNFQKGDTVCEIGAGMGRYARHLVDDAGHLYLCDTSLYACNLLGERFGGRDNVTIFRCNGNLLNAVPDNSVDLVFAIGVFMHLDAASIYNYLRESQRILGAGGKAVFDYCSITTPSGVEFLKRNLPTNGQFSIFQYHHPLAMRSLVMDAGLGIKSEAVDQANGYPEKVIIELVKP